jgi:hypothetical protein
MHQISYFVINVRSCTHVFCSKQLSSPRKMNLKLAVCMYPWSLKGFFHSSQKPTHKLAAARTFNQSQYLKTLAADLRFGFCDECKRGFRGCLHGSRVYNPSSRGTLLTRLRKSYFLNVVELRYH